MMTRMILAADSGGTKTEWLLMDEEGRKILSFRNEGMAAQKAGMLPVNQIVMEAADKVLEACGKSPDECIQAVYVSLGGPNGPEVEDACQRAWPKARISVEREARAIFMLEAAKDYGCQAVVMCGTGSTAAGFVNGKVKYAGGWGPVLGDGGSGGGLGTAALKCYLRSLDGSCDMGEVGKLFLPLESQADRTTFDGRMIIKERAVSMTRQELAALAPLIYRAYETGDAAAASLYRDQAAEIADLVIAVTEDDESSRVLLCGGFLKDKPALLEMIREETSKHSRAKIIYDPDFSPIRAAAMAALQLLKKISRP